MIPRVYYAVNAVASALATDGVIKARLNSRDNYRYRSIDDVLERLAPLLAVNRLCVLPRVLERRACDRTDEAGNLLIAVTVKAAFDLVSVEDGSRHTLEVFGEALDNGDKGTAKAMQSAYKYAILQAFCIPAAQGEDADAASHRLKSISQTSEPPSGWDRWCVELQERVVACAETHELDQLQELQRAHLIALRRERPDLYDLAGKRIAGRREELSSVSHAPIAQASRDRSPAKPKKRGRSSQANGSSPHV